MNPEERKILEQARIKRGNWNPKEKQTRKSYVEREEIEEMRKSAPKYKINDPQDPRVIPKNTEHAKRKGFKPGWISVWDPNAKNYYYVKGQGRRQETATDINKVLMPPPNLDRTDELDKLFNKTGMGQFGKTPVSVQQEEVQQPKSSTRIRGRSPSRGRQRSIPRIGTPSVGTRPQRGLSPESRALVMSGLKEFKGKVPKGPRDELLKPRVNPTRTTEAPAIISREQRTGPSFAIPTVVKPPPTKPPERVYGEDVREAWSNQPRRNQPQRKRDTKKVLRKQFRSTADAEEELKTINKRTLNEKYNLGIPEADLTNPKITLEHVKAILEKKQSAQYKKWAEERRKERLIQTAPERNFKREYENQVVANYPITKPFLHNLLSVNSNHGYEATNRKSAIELYIKNNKQEIGSWIGKVRKGEINPISVRHGISEGLKLKHHSHHNIVLNELMSHFIPILKKAGINFLPNERRPEVKAVGTPRGFVVGEQLKTTGKKATRGSTTLPMGKVTKENPRLKDIPFIPDEKTNSKFFTTEKDLKTHFLASTMRKWFESDEGEGNLIKRAGTIDRSKKFWSSQASTSNTIWKQRLTTKNSYDPYNELNAYFEKNTIEGEIKREKGNYAKLWQKMKEAVEKDNRYIVYQGKKNDGRNFMYGFLDTSKAINIGNGYVMLEFITDHHEERFKKDPIKRKKITPIFFFMSDEDLQIPNDKKNWREWGSKRKILSEYEYRLQYVKSMTNNETLTELAFILDYNTTKIYCDSPEARYRDDTAICMYDPTLIMKKWKEPTLVALEEWWSQYNSEEGKKSTWNSSLVHTNLGEILKKYTKDIPGEILIEKIKKFRLSGRGPGDTIFKSERLTEAEDETEARMNVYLTYKKFIEEDVSEEDFPQGKTNDSAVIFPIEQISTLVTSSMSITYRTIKSFIEGINGELDKLIKDCNEEQDCHETIISNIKNVVEFKSNKNREFEEKLTNITFIRDIINGLSNEVNDKEQEEIKKQSYRITKIEEGIRKEWEAVLSQKELQKILQEMINKNFDKLLSIKIERLDDLRFTEFASADNKLREIMEIQKEFHDEQEKFNVISQALKKNEFEITKNIMTDLEKIDKQIQESITNFDIAYAEDIEKRKKAAAEEERKRLEEEEKKRKEEAIASALKIALSRWKLAWEASEREKAEKAYRMELIGLYNSAIDENLKIKDEFENEIEVIKTKENQLLEKMNALDLTLYNNIANHTIDTDTILQTFKGDNFSVELGKQIQGIESLIAEFDALIEEYENSKLKTPLLKKLKEKKKDLKSKVTDLKNWETIPLEQSNVLKLDLDALNENDLDDKMDEIEKLKKTEGINHAILGVLAGIKDKIEKKKEEINKKKQEEKNNITQKLKDITVQRSKIMDSYDTVKATNQSTLTLRYTEIFNLFKEEEEIIEEINKINVTDQANLRTNIELKERKEEEMNTKIKKREKLAEDLNIELDSEERNVFNDVKKQKQDIVELKKEIDELDINDEYKELNEKKKLEVTKPLQDYEMELNKVIEIMGYGGEQESFEVNETPDEYERKIDAIGDLNIISTNLKDILKLKLKNLQYRSKLIEIGHKETAEEEKAKNIQNALIALEAKEEEERQRIAEEKRIAEELERQRIEEEKRKAEELERQRIEEEKERQRIEEERLAEIERLRLVEIARKKEEERQRKLEEVTNRLRAIEQEIQFKQRRNEVHHKKINEINDRLLNRLFKVSLKMSDQTYLGDSGPERDDKIKKLYMKNNDGQEADKVTMKQWYDDAIQERNAIFG